MELWQESIILIYGTIALFAFISGIHASSRKNKAYELTPVSGLLFSAFVQADKIIIGLFWFIASFICIVLNDWILFLLIFAIFWLVRSVGETIYWFLQQFVPRENNHPEKFIHHKIVGNDSVFIINQLYWQCITVVSTVFTIYLASLWLKKL